MKLFVLLVLTLALSPLAAAEPDVRPLCDGEPLVEIRECADLFRVRTCGGDGPAGAYGVTCLAIG